MIHLDCAQLQKMAEVLARNNGLLIVDLGNNKKISGEAAHPWNALNSVLDYHMIQACNLGITLQGLPLMRKIHLMISKSCELPDLSKCECGSAGKRHAHRLSSREKDKTYTDTMFAIHAIGRAPVAADTP